MTLTPYYSEGDITLYCGDVRELLPDVIAAHGIPDLTVADPCYGETSLDWDRWPDGWPSLIPGNSMWCFGSMRMFLDRRDEFASWKFSQDVVWEKHNGSGFATDRFKRVHEHVTHWYRSDWDNVYHETPRPVGGSGYKSVSRRGQTPHTGVIGTVGYTDDGHRLQRSVIYAQSMHGRAVNETEKPRGILEPLIEYGCPRDGTVFDPFAGSCSTLVAARALGRCAIGIELREKQCEKAVLGRLSQGVLTFGDVS
jgi:site-specific DNA-methyltransferase (adenine-specific)